MISLFGIDSMKEIIPDCSKNNQADQLTLKALIFRDDLGSFFWWVDPLGSINPLFLINLLNPVLIVW